MKPRRIDPVWALAFGYLVAPVVCILNSLIFSAVFADAGARGFKATNFHASIAISTMLLGLVTMRLIRLWNGGSYLEARLWSVGCGIICTAFWVWIGQTLIRSQTFFPSMIGGLLLPWLWSLGFFIFAFFARLPKN